MALISPVKKNNRREPSLKKNIYKKNQAVVNIQEKQAYKFECHWMILDHSGISI